jgi:hypothetical protein
VVSQSTQSDWKADRQVANTLAEVIIGGSLASVPLDEDQGRATLKAYRGEP